MTNMVISNVPVPLTIIYFWYKEVSNMGAVRPNIGTSRFTLLITSFYGKVKLVFLSDKDLPMDSKELMKHFENQIDASIAEANKMN